MRSFYRFLLQMHPADFRERFGDEMELVYDDAAGSWGAASLLTDAGLSLGRQWLFRDVIWKWVAAGVGGTIPLILSFGSFIPWGNVWAVVRACF